MIRKYLWIHASLEYKPQQMGKKHFWIEAASSIGLVMVYYIRANTVQLLIRTPSWLEHHRFTIFQVKKVILRQKLGKIWI